MKTKFQNSKVTRCHSIFIYFWKIVKEELSLIYKIGAVEWLMAVCFNIQSATVDCINSVKETVLDNADTKMN